jgi:quinoprotein glucose dehydrogenase
MNLGGSIATAGGLLFIGASNDHQFRAFESKTGKLLWQQSIDANGHTVPITYLGKDGRQYVAIMAAGGGGYFGGAPADTLIGFALPAAGARTEPQVITERTGSKPVVPESKASLQPAPRTLPEGPGRDLVARTCAGQCHDIRTVTSHRMSPAEWSAMVETMINRGAKANETDAKAITDYLAVHFGPAR